MSTFEDQYKKFIGDEYFPDDNHEVLKYRFIEVCRTILYSKSQRDVDKAFNMLTKDFAHYIQYSEDSVSLSIFEQVVNKIFTDAEDIEHQVRTGQKYDHFIRLISMLRQSDLTFIKAGQSNAIIYKYITKLSDSALTESRRKYIKLILKKDVVCFT